MPTTQGSQTAISFKDYPSGQNYSASRPQAPASLSHPSYRLLWPTPLSFAVFPMLCSKVQILLSLPCSALKYTHLWGEGNLEWREEGKLQPCAQEKTVKHLKTLHLVVPRTKTSS